MPTIDYQVVAHCPRGTGSPVALEAGVARRKAGYGALPVGFVLFEGCLVD